MPYFARNKYTYTYWIIVGALVGVGVGIMNDHIIIGIAIGVALGAAVGFGYKQVLKKDTRK